MKLKNISWKKKQDGYFGTIDKHPVAVINIRPYVADKKKIRSSTKVKMGFYATILGTFGKTRYLAPEKPCRSLHNAKKIVDETIKKEIKRTTETIKKYLQ